MDQTPKRSVGETIGQLVVIAVLIAILVGTVILLRDYIDRHNASTSSSATALVGPQSSVVNANVLMWTPFQVDPLP